MNDTTSDEILGKEAVDPEGQVLGIVSKIHISNTDKQIQGITIDQGFIKADLFVGIDYIKYFGVDSILLKKVPVDKFKGLHVLSAQGHFKGTVKDVLLSNKKIKGIVVSYKKGFLSKGIVTLSPHDIEGIGTSVILKEKVDFEAMK